MVSIASFRSSSINNDVNLVNYRPVKSKIDNKAGYPLRILHTLVQIWSLMAPKKNKMVTAEMPNSRLQLCNPQVITVN